LTVNRPREIFLSLPGRDQSYRIVIAPGLRHRLGSFLESLRFPRRFFLLTDTRVARLYGAEISTSLQEAGFSPVILTIRPGERAKSWPVAVRLARRLLALEADRGTALVALGGGVVGDLTGFLASIYLRGVPFIQVPTTLLAMVDASIGGKTAVNLPEGKNLLGTFHQPRLVAIDPEFLNTLPRSEWLNGLAEVLKAGFIRDPGLLGRVGKTTSCLLKNQDDLSDIIHRAAAIKAEIVAADERETDRRRLLNFGHTIGHALEAASGYRLPHGQAVAWGMLAALEISVQLADLPLETARYGATLIRECGLAKTLPGLDFPPILAALTRDKKRQHHELVFVLLKDLGEPVIYPGVPLSLVDRIIRKKLSMSGEQQAVISS